MHGPSLNSLSRFSENLRKSSCKIDENRLFLPTISHTCVAIKPPCGNNGFQKKMITKTTMTTKAA